MSEFNDQTRPSARHRDEHNAPLTKSQAILKNAARQGKSGHRMSVVAGVVAAALGVASLGTAANAALNLPETSRVAETQAAAQLSDNRSASTEAAAEKSAADRAAAAKAAADKAAAEKAVADKAAADKAAADQAAAEKAAAEKAAADQAAAEKAAADAAAKQAADAAAAAAAAEAAAAAAAPKAVDDPAAAKAYAASILGSYGWSAGEMTALNTLWEKESNWKTTATNASSGAYGIVQSLPASKMATAGADWQTNYQTQIKWGLNYIKERYGSPSAALAFHLANNWY
jgi:colicin import membrane protein